MVPPHTTCHINVSPGVFPLNLGSFAALNIALGGGNRGGKTPLWRGVYLSIRDCSYISKPSGHCVIGLLKFQARTAISSSQILRLIE